MADHEQRLVRGWTRLAAILAVILVAWVLAGCGGGASSTGGSTPEDTGDTGDTGPDPACLVNSITLGTTTSQGGPACSPVAIDGWSDSVNYTVEASLDTGESVTLSWGLSAGANPLYFSEQVTATYVNSSGSTCGLSGSSSLSRTDAENVGDHMTGTFTITETGSGGTGCSEGLDIDGSFDIVRTADRPAP